jgi:hypothetical protein
LKRLNSRFLGPRMRHRVRSQNLGVSVGIGSVNTMRCQCNKIRLAPASSANKLTIGQALASVGAPHSACPSGFLSPRSRSPGIACRMFNTSWAKVPQIRIDALRSDFGFSSGLWRMEAQRLRCNCNSAYGSGALDEGSRPRSSRAARCNWACVFITIEDGFPKRVTCGSHRDVRSSSALPQLADVLRRVR